MHTPFGRRTNGHVIDSPRSEPSHEGLAHDGAAFTASSNASSSLLGPAPRLATRPPVMASFRASQELLEGPRRAPELASGPFSLDGRERRFDVLLQVHETLLEIVGLEERAAEHRPSVCKNRLGEDLGVEGAHLFDSLLSGSERCLEAFQLAQTVRTTSIGKARIPGRVFGRRREPRRRRSRDSPSRKPMLTRGDTAGQTQRRQRVPRTRQRAVGVLSRIGPQLSLSSFTMKAVRSGATRVTTAASPHGSPATRCARSVFARRAASRGSGWVASEIRGEKARPRSSRPCPRSCAHSSTRIALTREAPARHGEVAVEVSVLVGSAYHLVDRRVSRRSPRPPRGGPASARAHDGGSRREGNAAAYRRGRNARSRPWLAW